MIQYLLTVSTCWIAFYVIYHVFLKKETFFGSNRGYLLFSLGMGLLIPAYQWIPSTWYSNSEPLQAFFFYSEDIITVSSTAASTSLSLIDYMMILYWAVVGVMFIKLSIGLLKIYNLFRGGDKTRLNGLNVVKTVGLHLPFSFMQTVYISKSVPLNEEVESIFSHEKVHVESWHTLDVLFIEVLHIFFWFNPILIFYKKSLQQVHEYAADATVIKDTISRKSYGQLLLRQSQSGLEIALANHFFQSQIKKRISMMYKEKSKRSALIKYLTVIPVFLLLLFVFSSHTTNPKLKEDVQEQMDLRAEIGDAKTAKNIGKVVEDYLAKEDNYEEAIDAIEAIASQHGFSISIDKRTVTRIAFDKPMQRSEEIDLGLMKFYKGDEGNEVVKFNFKDKGKVAIRFEKEGDKVKFAEVVPGQSEITDKETLKDALKTFYDLPVPPPPPPSPPAAPKAFKALIPPPPPPPPGAPECIDVFKVVEQMPRFPGCEHLADKGKSSLEIEQCAKEKMITYIYSNVKYPKDARENGVQGTVVIQFVVESDGAIAGIKLLRDPGSGLGSEAVRVVQSFNSMDEQWTPGKHKGKNVDVIYTLPVKFKLDGDDEKADKIISVGEAQNVINLESTSSDPIIFIDGKEVEKGASNDLDPDDIATINVFKGEKAIAKFGAKAVNGVLEIVTKAALKSDNDKEVFIVVEEMPRFPGCEDIQDKSEQYDCSKQNLLTYIYENVKYSDKAKKAGTEGTSVVQFTITKTGYVDDIKLLRDPGNGLGEEATKVVKLMQKEITWIPGKQRGKVVSVKYTLPIKFKLEDKHTKEDVRSLDLKNFSLSPNPSSGRFRLQFEGEAGPVRIDVRDMAGNLLHQLDDEDFLGRFDKEVVHPSFVKKSAIVTIIQGDKSTSKKIIFQ